MTQESATTVARLIAQGGRWSGIMEGIRRQALDSGLTEEVKWGKPCYTLDGANVAIIQGFKEYCALLFFKGALLKDTEGILVQQTENVQAARQLRFTSVAELQRCGKAVRKYLAEAIANERTGRKVVFKKTSDFAVPEELKRRLRSDPALRKAFE